MPSFSDIGKLIERNLERFRRPGVLAVRPGYRTEAGWPTGAPRIIVLVATKKGEADAYGIPAQLSGVPVEIRTASPLERLKATRPDTHAALKERARAESHAPDFPFEHALATHVTPVKGAAAVARRPVKPEVPYTTPPDVPLEPIQDKFTVLCHASPDAGWPTLKAFLGRIQNRLTVGMYDFTSAHILSALEGSLAGGRAKELSLVLDHPARNATADQTDEQTQQDLQAKLGKDLSFAWAAVRSSPEVSKWIFPSAYHIKVAVRDSIELWLSSGNWNNSNQPEDAPISDPDPAHAGEVFKTSDRDWHVVIAHPRLAQMFEAYLQNDRSCAGDLQGGMAASVELEALAEQAADITEISPAAQALAPAQFFEPAAITGAMTIQPLLTPDFTPEGGTGIYARKMLELISSAQQTLYIQLQYIHPSEKAEEAAYTALLDAVSERAAAGVDVRIILSQWQNSQWMERLKAAGIDTELVRIQNGVHNKGFVVDHQVVVVSSQNWSGDGVLKNRDAGLVISNAQVAQYFEQIFLHDWEHLAVSHAVQLVSAVAPAPSSTTLAWRRTPAPPTGAPVRRKVSPLLEDELQVRDVAQAIVILERDSGLAMARAFPDQANQIEQHFVMDERSWSASLARARQASAARDSRTATATGSVRRRDAGKPRRFASLGILLGDIRAEGLAALRQHPAVRYIASSVSLSLVRPVRVAAAAPDQTTTWGIDRLGVSALWNAGYDGKDVQIGHIDTGVDGTHPALKGAIGDYLLTDEEGFPVPNAPIRDTAEHGTHTAGTIAGRPVGGRRVGVAPGASLHCAAVIEGGNVVARILAGLDWAVTSGVKIVSMSLGIRGYHSDFYEIMRTLRDRGVLAVVAVGNESAGSSRSPGNYDVVLSVGACDANGLVADFSSSESFSQPAPRRVPDIIAPGVGVISAHAGGGFISMDGTSMATPHIAGLAALLWQAQPQATVDQVQGAILQSCVLIPGDTAERAGRGLPDARRAFQILTGRSLAAAAAKVSPLVEAKRKRAGLPQAAGEVPALKGPLSTRKRGRRK